MTTGTPGNDLLTNDTSQSQETVNALAGDDLITVNQPQKTSPLEHNVFVNGGDGYDTLTWTWTNGRFFWAAPTGTDDGQFVLQVDAFLTYRVHWTAVEQLNFQIRLGGTSGTTWTSGNTKDILHISFGSTGTASVSTGGGNDEIYSSGSTSGTQLTVDAGTGDDLIDFRGTINAATLTLMGGSGNDTIIGSDRGDESSGTFRDQLFGGDGNDVLDGHAGSDKMVGGLGDDVFYVDVAAATGIFGDLVVENANEGTDEVRTALATYTLPANVENLTGLSTGSQTLNGNALDNVITVATGTTTVNGASGRDRLFIDASAAASGVTLSALTPGADGYSGSASWSTGSTAFQNIDDITIRSSTGNYQDLITTGAGNDVFYHYGINDPAYLMDIVDLGGGTDTGIADFSAVTDYAVTSQLLPNGHFLYSVGGNGKLELANTENVDITGGALGDTFTGFDGDDVLRGGGGNDVLAGGLGSDRLYDGLGDDTLSGGDGNDIITVSSGIDSVDGGADFDTLVVDYSTATNGISGGIGVGYLTDGVPTFQVVFTGVEKFDITTGSGNDNIVMGAGDDIVRLNAGDDFVNIGSGTDIADGGAGNDGISADLSAAASAIAWDLVTNTYSGPAGTSFANFEYFGTVATAGGNDAIVSGLGSHDETINAGGGDDSIKVFGGSDNVDGGAGTNDKLIVDYSTATNNIVGGATSGYFNDGTSATQVLFTGIELFDVTSGSGNDTLTGGTGNDRFLGMAGTDTLVGGGGDDWLDGGAGDDDMTGGTGNDVYVVDSLSDQVHENSGEGTDEIRTLLNTYVLGAANVENLSFGGTGNADLRGNSGDNVVTGGAGDDFLRLQDGGNDTAVGGNGADAFYFGNALDNGDHVDGGAGSDVVAIQGAGYGAFTLGSGNLVGVETLSILTGSDARFGDTANNLYDYNITTLDANVAAGTQLIVNASSLLAGEDFTFNGAAETNGTFFIYAGAGVDNLTGGSGVDVFFFADGRWGSSDQVQGGAGNDIVVLRGDYTVTFGATQLTGVETVTLMSAADTRFYSGGTRYHYDITIDNGNVPAGQTVTFNAGSLQSDETFHFNGTAETDGHMRIFGGAGNDVIHGGTQDDLIFGGIGADTLTGGGGNDTFRYQATNESTAAAQDGIQDFNAGDIIDLSRIDANTKVVGNQAFTFIGNAAFGNHAGELRAVDQGGGIWQVQGDTNGDGVVDFQVSVVVTDHATHPLTGSDFLL